MHATQKDDRTHAAASDVEQRSQQDDIEKKEYRDHAGGNRHCTTVQQMQHGIAGPFEGQDQRDEKCRPAKGRDRRQPRLKQH